MSDIVIKAENLGKKYVIGHQTEKGRYTALRDVVMQNARSLWRKTKELVQGKPIIQGDETEETAAEANIQSVMRREPGTASLRARNTEQPTASRAFLGGWLRWCALGVVIGLAAGAYYARMPVKRRKQGKRKDQ